MPGHGATTFIQINKEKTTLKDEGVRLDHLGLYGVGLGRPNESHETVQVTCTLEVPRWGEARRPVPTAASVAAAELGPYQGKVIRAPAGNAVERNERVFYALLALMLCKTPSVPQRCLNCAEARSPQTALALAGKLSPALSTRTRRFARHS